MLSQLTFRFKTITSLYPHQSLSILGNIPELGLWNDPIYHPLLPDPLLANYYLSKVPLAIPSFSSFQYKLVIIEEGSIIHWESLPSGLNRVFTVENPFITLKGIEGELLVQETPFFSFQTALDIDEITLLNKRKNKLDNSMLSEMELEREQSFIERALNRSSSSLIKGQSKTKLKPKQRSDYEKPKIRLKYSKDSKSISETSISSLNQSLIQTSRQEIAGFVKEITQKEKILKRMDLQQMYLKMLEKHSGRSQQLSLLRSQNDMVYNIAEDCIINVNYDEIFFVIMSYLPLKLQYNSKEKDWEVNCTPDHELLKHFSHFFSQSRNQYKRMYCVGMLNQSIPLSEQAKIQKLLYDNYRCIVLFTLPSVHLDYILYNYEYLDPILNNSFNLANCSIGVLERFSSSYEAFRTINKSLADLVTVSNKETPLVFVLDFHLLLIPYFLSIRVNKPAIVFYYGNTFPCYESFQLLQFNEELLSSMLLASLLCFDKFCDARQFLITISNVLGLKYESHRGDLLIRYMGRQIKIKILPLGIDTTALEMIKRAPEFGEACKGLALKHKNKKVVFNQDPLNKLALLDVKLRLYAKLLAENPNISSEVLFVQIVTPSYWDLQVLKDPTTNGTLLSYLKSLSVLLKEIGYGVLWIINLDTKEFEGNQDLIDIMESFSVQRLRKIEIYAYMSIAELFLKADLRNQNSIEALEFLFFNEGKGQVLFSEFVPLNPLFTRVNKFNPFCSEMFRLKALSILYPPDPTLEDSLYPYLESNAPLLKKHTVISWLESSLFDLKKSIMFAKHTNYTKVEKLTSYHSVTYFKLATNELFKYLNFKEVLHNYTNSYNRVIIMDYEGTIVDSNNFSDPNELKDLSGNPIMILKPSSVMLEGLKALCVDPRNSVFIITGKAPREIGPWILELRNLNVFCEYGYLIRLKRSGNDWIRLYECKDWRWKDRGVELMSCYEKNTQGSWVSVKESGVVWNFGEVPEDFGWKEADLLEKQLKGELDNVKEIEIIRGTHYVEIRPYGINKVLYIFLSI